MGVTLIALAWCTNDSCEFVPVTQQPTDKPAATIIADSTMRLITRPLPQFREELCLAVVSVWAPTIVFIFPPFVPGWLKPLPGCCHGTFLQVSIRHINSQTVVLIVTPLGKEV